MKLLLFGLAAVAARQVQLWRRDMSLADQLRAERSVTPVVGGAPLISALVAAWNEGENVAGLIESFLALDYPGSELIICAGGTDETLALARRYEAARVQVIEQRAGEGKQAALARCLDAARGDLIYLIDADCRFSREALDQLLAPIVSEGEEVVSGEIRPLDRQMGEVLPRYLWAVELAAAARAGKYADGLRGANALITRRALDASGGLRFEARTGTDYQLAQRLLAHDFRIRYAPASIVPTEYPARLGEHRKRQSRWLLNLLLHGRRYGARQHVTAATRALAVGAVMTLGPLAALLLRRVALVPWLLLLAQATGAKVRYTLFAARLNRLPLSPPLLAALLPLTLLDFVIWASALFDLLPGRRERW